MIQFDSRRSHLRLWEQAKRGDQQRQMDRQRWGITKAGWSDCRGEFLYDFTRKKKGGNVMKCPILSVKHYFLQDDVFVLSVLLFWRE